MLSPLLVWIRPRSSRMCWIVRFDLFLSEPETAWHVMGHRFPLREGSSCLSYKQSQRRNASRQEVDQRVEPRTLHEARCQHQPPSPSQCIYCSHFIWAVNVADWVRRREHEGSTVGELNYTTTQGIFLIFRQSRWSGNGERESGRFGRVRHVHADAFLLVKRARSSEGECGSSRCVITSADLQLAQINSSENWEIVLQCYKLRDQLKLCQFVVFLSDVMLSTFFWSGPVPCVLLLFSCSLWIVPFSLVFQCLRPATLSPRCPWRGWGGALPVLQWETVYIIQPVPSPPSFPLVPHPLAFTCVLTNMELFLFKCISPCLT